MSPAPPTTIAITIFSVPPPRHRPSERDARPNPGRHARRQGGVAVQDQGLRLAHRSLEKGALRRLFLPPSPLMEKWRTSKYRELCSFSHLSAEVFFFCKHSQIKVFKIQTSSVSNVNTTYCFFVLCCFFWSKNSVLHGSIFGLTVFWPIFDACVFLKPLCLSASCIRICANVTRPLGFLVCSCFQQWGLCTCGQRSL